ncbi:hypothetical protein AB0K51_09490 [Kitasatospora sp. NPDC049285]|uniref:hypothetical protein n=1 Tax=Kitasatospora sp. NPDC049285 TaxID=3157096 RepID=UPI003413BE45
MSHPLKLAPLPDHGNITDPTWQTYYANYAHVITPLRQFGWTTDIQLSFGVRIIRAIVGDGTELHIGSVAGLPLDPRQVKSWVVTRVAEDQTRPGLTVLYDSTEDGAQRHHGAEIGPMLGRVRRVLRVAPPEGRSYQIVSTAYRAAGATTDHYPAGSRAEALSVYETCAEALATELWTRIYAPSWPEPSDPDPAPDSEPPALALSVWALGPDVTVLRIAAV